MTAKRNSPTPIVMAKRWTTTIVRVNNTYNIKKETPIELIRTFERPILGTLTRAR